MWAHHFLLISVINRRRTIFFSATCNNRVQIGVLPRVSAFLIFFDSFLCFSTVRETIRPLFVHQSSPPQDVRYLVSVILQAEAGQSLQSYVSRQRITAKHFFILRLCNGRTLPLTKAFGKDQTIHGRDNTCSHSHRPGRRQHRNQRTAGAHHANLQTVHCAAETDQCKIGYEHSGSVAPDAPVLCQARTSDADQHFSPEGPV